MKPEADWGTWLSMAAVAIVGMATALRVMPAASAPQPAAEARKPERKGPGPFLTYRLDRPDSTFVLSKVLDEISGLSAAKDPGSLWAVHDERGTLFRIALADGAVLEQIPLGKRGDYEGVEEVEDKVYVARSEGVLFVVDPKGGAPIEKLNFQRGLGLACDLEGVGYQPQAKRLLLTCKNESSKTRRSNKAFEIYAMDLATKRLQREPVYVLREEAIDDFIAAHPEREELKKSKGKTFAPSGIAVHPSTGELYVSSTRGKMVVVLDPAGALVQVYALPEAVHPQPEGIAIARDGTLFISNEAHGKRAVLLGFRAQTGRAAQE